MRTCATILIAALLILAPASDAIAAGRVFIDPGHGGKYPGAVQGGVYEKAINLAIGQALNEILAARG